MIKVLKPGLFTTLQDSGRWGYQHEGIPLSGYLDSYCASLANWLVGNYKDDTVIEAIQVGPVLEFLSDASIAVTGAKSQVFINDEPVKMNKTLKIFKGNILKAERLNDGNCIYISVAGGIIGDNFLNSKSTYTRGGFGGYNGRQLKKGDIIKIEKSDFHKQLEIEEYLLPRFNKPPVIRFIKGPEFDPGIQLENTFTVDSSSDRMGIRLKGLKETAIKKEVITSGITPGTIQLLPNQDLIVLMNDGQVSGGYPRVANIISADMHKLAQVKAGNKIKLIETSLGKAVNLWKYQQNLLKELYN